MHVQVTRSIAAKPETVWAILTNKQRIADRSFGIERLEGDIALGGTLKVWSEVSPNLAFALEVSTFAPPHEMVWQSGMPLGLFKGIRTFTVQPTPEGCTFRMREDYTGILKSLICKSIPDLNPSFNKFADALKHCAEGEA